MLKIASNICLSCEQNKYDFELNSCKHVFCSECLCKYLKTFSTAKIKCPLRYCSALIPDQIIRKCLTNVQIEIYDELYYSSSSVKCVIDGCSYFVASGDRKGHFVCPFCKQPNCATCSNLHEKNEPCGISLRKRTYEEKARANLLEKSRQDLLKLRKENCLNFNSESSECLICAKFLLPREGIITTPCMHISCRDCLQNHLEGASSIHQLTCGACDVLLDDGQSVELIGLEKVEALNIRNVQLLFFNCQTPHCTSFWDPGDCTTSHKCEKCGHFNCIPCHAIHEGQSCDEYKQSDAYKLYLKDLETVKALNAINCYNCNNSIIKSGGSGALLCDRCGKQVCAFSGKAVGPTGCQCRKSKRCHPNCIIGCIPDERGREAEELRNYYYER